MKPPAWTQYAVGRPRKHDRHLPQRMYCRRGAYYFAHPDGRWIPLGKQEASAYRAYGDHMASTMDTETMAGVLARYRLEVIPKKAEATRKGNLQQIRNVERAFGHMKPSSIRAKHAYAFLDAGRASPYQANREFEVLSHALSKCVEWGIIDINPLIGVKKHQQQASETRVSSSSYRALYKSAPPVLQVAMDLAVLTGQRQRAVLALTVADARKDGLHMIGTKGGRPVIVRWTPRLRAVVGRAKRLHGEPSGPLLRTRRGKPFTTSGFQTLWQRAARAVLGDKGADGRFSFHDLRALAAERSKDPSGLLGHTNPNTTRKHYLRGPRVVQPTA